MRYYHKQLYLINSLNTRNIVKFKDFILANWNTFKYVRLETSVPLRFSLSYPWPYIRRGPSKRRNTTRVFNLSHARDFVQKDRVKKNKLDLLVLSHFFLFYFALAVHLTVV